MLTLADASALLSRFGLLLTSEQLDKLVAYLDILTRWNRRINLTSTCPAEEIVVRHFGESLYLSRWLCLRGRNLDIGSGAGFPGLALKIVFHDLEATLLEPVAKKRVFLKEVARVCEMASVEVRPERYQEYARDCKHRAFDSVTSRALGDVRRMLSETVSLLKLDGTLCLWLNKELGEELVGCSEELSWRRPRHIPGATRRVILVADRVEESLSSSQPESAR